MSDQADREAVCFRVEFDPVTNGKLGPTTILVFDKETGRLLKTDQANLMREEARRKVAERLAKRLKTDHEPLLAQIEDAWNKAVEDHRRQQYAEDGQPEAEHQEEPNELPPQGVTNYRTVSDGEHKTKVGLPAADIARQILTVTNGWPKRVGSNLFVEDREIHAPFWLTTPDACFAWLARQLPSDYGFHPILWANGDGKLSESKMVEFLRQTVERFEAVEAYPHWPQLKGHYYLHPPLRPQGGKALKSLLNRFSPASAVDADLIKAMFLSLVWGGPAGQRPAFLFDSEEDDPQGGRGIGKTALPQAAARLVGGYMDARPSENFEKLKSRLLSPTALGQRVILLDNVKALRFSWADLEGLITATTISGHEYYVGEGRRPNSLLWCITLNRASMSRDLAQRCVPIHLRRPLHDATWERDTTNYIEACRWEILGDIVEELQRPVPALKNFSRWSAWEAAVLSHVNNPAEAQEVIAARQGAIDEDTAEAEMVRQGFIKELTRRGHSPATDAIWISADDAAVIVNEATGEKLPKNRAGVYLGTLTIAELRRSNCGTRGRGWAWRGSESSPGRALCDLNPPTPEWTRGGGR